MKKLSVILLAVILALLCFACAPKSKNYVVLTFMDGDKVYTTVRLDENNNGAMPENPRKLGYAFKGWFYDLNFRLPFNEEDGLRYDTVLYAKWEQLESGGGDEVIDKGDANFVYELIGDKYVLTKYIGTSVSVTLPTIYDNKIVDEARGNVFADNATVEVVTIPSSYIRIEETVFRNCKNLRQVNVNTGSHYYASEKGVLYNKAMSVLILMPAKWSGSLEEDSPKFVVPDTVQKIEGYAFWNSNAQVTFARYSQCYMLHSNAFNSFRGKVTLSANTTDLQDRVFAEATGEVDLSLSQIKTVKPGMFAGFCGKPLILGKTVENIDKYAFSNCTAEVRLENTSVTKLYNNAFADYKGEKLVVPAKIESLGDSVFYRCTSKITFATDSPITKITTKAFYMFRGEVYLLAKVTEIESGAFLQMNSGCVWIFDQSPLTYKDFEFDVASAEKLLKRYANYEKN